MASKKSAPVEEFEDIIVEEDIVEDDIVEVEPEAVLEEGVEPTPANPDGPVFIRAINADSYLSIAERCRRDDISVKEYARQIAELNGHAALRHNARVRIR